MSLRPALFGLAAAVAALPAQDSGPVGLLERAATAYRSARSVRAPFEQQLTNPLTATTHVARGEFTQRGQRRFALRFTDPAGDAIVSDGMFVWMYLPSTAKGQVIKLPSAAGAGLDFIGELLTAPRDHYAVAALGLENVEGHECLLFALAPKSPRAPFISAKVWIGIEDALLWQLETVEPSSLVRKVRFTAVHLNGALRNGVLTFEPPPGTRIVDQQSLVGGTPRKP